MTVLTDNCVAYWKFDGNANDSVGTANGTVTGATNNVSYGRINQGYYFNGASDKIVVADQVPLRQTGDMSIRFFIYVVGTANSYIFGKRTAGNVAGPYNVYIAGSGGNNTIYFYLGDGVTTQQSVTCGSTFANSGWHQIVITRTGTSIKFYIDNNAANSQTMTAVTPGDAGQSLYITNNVGNGATFPGYLDEIGLWSRVLTAGEVTSLYNLGAGLQYPFVSGYTKKFNGITAYSKINGIAVANIAKVNGI